MKNKRGWIRIVEAFLSVLLITVVLIIVVNQQSAQKNDPSSKMYDYEIYIIRGLEFNDTIRNEIVSISNSILPLTSGQSAFPQDVINQIANATPSSLLCAAQICNTNSICNFGQKIDRDVYAQRVFITSSLQSYSPKQLKIFCWSK